MKPRIFIGSSTEGLPIAERVKNYFIKNYDCYLWNDDIFKNNESFLDTLIKSSSLFDFAFMIFSADDAVVIRDEHFETARDNILFEYGLFLGRVGVDRAFIIAQENVKIPTDMLGITHTKYKVKSDSKGKYIATSSLEDGLLKLKKQIDANVSLGHLGLLPSTVIAISYFEGFVKLAAKWLVMNTPNLKINGQYYEDGIIKIVIPDSLDTDIKDSAMLYYKKHGLQEFTIETEQRNYPIHFTGKNEQNVLEIYDMPTILTGIDKAIDMYFRVGHIGKKIEQHLAEENELNNFRRVLQLLINEDACCREHVIIL